MKRRFSLQIALKILGLAASLLIFILSLKLIQSGVSAIEPFVRDTLSVTNPLNSLGFGWLLAYALLSGSPAAAIAMTFLDDGSITSLEAFTMIAGSRLGAGMFVLLIGGFYVWRGQEVRSSLSIGMLSLLLTASIQIPALAVGYILLESGVLDPIDFRFGMLNALDSLFNPVLELAQNLLPTLGVFFVGVLCLLLAFRLFDRSLPQPEIGDRGFDKLPTLLYRPLVMFLLGMLITMMTFSVAVSVGLLVPLSARGLIRRENLIPYIMGCNVSTYLDTLVIAMLLGTNEGMRVVLAAMLANAIVTTAILLIGFRPFQTGIDNSVSWSLESLKHVGIVIALLLGIPVILLVM